MEEPFHVALGFRVFRVSGVGFRVEGLQISDLGFRGVGRVGNVACSYYAASLR